MPIDIIALRAAHAAGATADVIMALVEAQCAKIVKGKEAKRERKAARAAKIESRRAKDRERKRRAKLSSGTLRNSTGTPWNSAEFHRKGAATPPAPPSAGGAQSAEPLGIESVDKISPASEQGLTKQGDSLLSSLLPSFDESSNSKEKKEVDTHAREATESLFEKFWAAYPNKVGKRDAANSFRRIMKLGIVGIDDLMAGLARYVAKTDDRPWCNPATWLNGGRWEDQPSLFNGGSNGQHQNGSNGSGGGHVGGFASYAIKHARLAAAARAEREKGQ